MTEAQVNTENIWVNLEEEENVHVDHTEIDDEAYACNAEEGYCTVESSDESFGRAGAVVEEEVDGCKWNTNYDDPLIHIGRRFKDKVELKSCLIQHNVNENFSFHFIKNEKNRVVVRCSGNACPWYVRAKLLLDAITKEITRHLAKHTCTRVNKVENLQASADWMANDICFKSRPIQT